MYLIVEHQFRRKIKFWIFFSKNSRSIRMQRNSKIKNLTNLDRPKKETDAITQLLDPTKS